MSERRYNTRKSTRRKTAVPHASHYIGYCEDYETPEMIMKKFEELEKIEQLKKEQKRKLEEEKNKHSKNKNKKSGKAEIDDDDDDDDDDDNEDDSSTETKTDNNDNNNDNNNNNNNNGSNFEGTDLTEEDLSKLFQQTSMFSVSSVMKNNEILHEKPIISADGFIMGYDTNILNYELADAADYNIFDEFAAMGDGEFIYNSEDNEYYNDSNESDFYEDVLKYSKSKRSGGTTRSASGPRAPRKGGTKSRGDGYYQPRVTSRVGEMSGFKGFDYTLSGVRDHDGKQKEKIVDKLPCDEVHYTKVPLHPLPRSWAHKIQPFDSKRFKIKDDNDGMKLAEQQYIGFKYHLHDNLTDLKVSDFGYKKNNKKFVAILINCPFDLTDSVVSPKPGCISVEQYRQLPIGDLMDNGFLFVWTPSELIYEVCTIAEEWGFTYADHACWVKKERNNKFTQQRGLFFREAKDNLLLFRKAKEPLFVDDPKNKSKPTEDGTCYSLVDFDAKNYAGKIDLRHQRTSDVYFNFVRYDRKYNKCQIKPSEYAFDMIETLLPESTSHFEKILNKYEGDESKITKQEWDSVDSNMLYLWAPEFEVRRGWTMMVDKKHMQFLEEQQKKP